MAIEAKNERLSIDKKILLTIYEAAEYSNIGINRISDMLKQPGCTFVFYNGNRKLVKRKEFEDYISKSLSCSFDSYNFM